MAATPRVVEIKLEDVVDRTSHTTPRSNRGRL
jgi:hypothetical protein